MGCGPMTCGAPRFDAILRILADSPVATAWAVATLRAVWGERFCFRERLREARRQRPEMRLCVGGSLLGWGLTRLGRSRGRRRAAAATASRRSTAPSRATAPRGAARAKPRCSSAPRRRTSRRATPRAPRGAPRRRWGPSRSGMPSALQFRVAHASWPRAARPRAARPPAARAPARQYRAAGLRARARARTSAPPTPHAPAHAPRVARWVCLRALHARPLRAARAPPDAPTARRRPDRARPRCEGRAHF